MKKIAILILSILIAGLFVACEQDITVDAQTYANMEVGTFVLNGQNYATLQEAVNAKLGKGVKSSKAAGGNDGIIYLMKNTSGPGAVIDQHIAGGVIIDFNNYTYSFTNVTGLQGGDNPKAETFGLGITNGADVTLRGLQQIDLNDRSTTDLTMVYVAGKDTKLTIEDAPKMKVEDDQYVFWAADGATLTIGNATDDSATVTGKVAATGGDTEESKPTVNLSGNISVQKVEATAAKVTLSETASVETVSAKSGSEFTTTGTSTVTKAVEATESKVTIAGNTQVTGTITADKSDVSVTETSTINAAVQASNESTVAITSEGNVITNLDKTTDSTIVVTEIVQVDEVTAGEGKDNVVITTGDGEVTDSTGDPSQDVDTEEGSSKYVALVDSTLYEDMATAVAAAATNNKTLYLSADDTEIIILSENTVMLDLGGFDVTTINSNGTLLIQGSGNVESITTESTKTVIEGGTYTVNPTSLGSIPIYCEVTGSSPWTVSRKTLGVASITRDGKVLLYSSLADAFKDVKEKETIQVEENTETGSAYTITDPLILNIDNVTLDLNGKKITSTNNFSFLISGNGDIVKNGIIDAGANAGKNCGYNSYALVLNGCDGVVLDGLTIKGGVSAGGSTGETPSPAAATNAVMKNCNVTSGDYYAVCAQQNSTLTIESGFYKKEPTYGTGVIQATFVGTDGPKGTITVTGGEFEGGITNSNDAGDIILKGGVYDFDSIDYVAEGYWAFKTSDSSWTVSYVEDDEYVDIEDMHRLNKYITEPYYRGRIDKDHIVVNAAMTLNGDKVMDLNGNTLDVALASGMPFVFTNGESMTVEANNGGMLITNTTTNGLFRIQSPRSEIILNGGNYKCYTPDASAIIWVNNAYSVNVELNDVTGECYGQFVRFFSYASGYDHRLKVKGGQFTFQNDGINVDGSVTGFVGHANVEFDGVTATSQIGAIIEMDGGSGLFMNNVFTEHSPNNIQAWNSTTIGISYGAVVTIESGTYSGYYGLSIFSHGGHFIVNGGTITGTSHAFDLYDNDKKYYPNDPTLDITGGTVNGDIFLEGTQPIVSITGGTFDHDPSAYVADGYGVIYDKDNNTFEVVESWTKGLEPYTEATDLEISTAEELAKYALSSKTLDYAGHTVKLTADIDLEGKAWTPIYVKYGATFDGQDHVISNMNVVGKKEVGLFGTTTGLNVSNVVLDNAVVVGINHVGGIVGHGQCARIEDCTVKNSYIKAYVYNNDDGDKVGAITGYLTADVPAETLADLCPSILNCTVENCQIIGYRDVGSFAGMAQLLLVTAEVEMTGSVSNVTLVNDRTVNYKSYETDAQYDVNDVIGENTGTHKYGISSVNTSSVTKEVLQPNT